MFLSKFDLEDIGKVLQQVEDMGIEVETFKVGDHRIMLAWREEGSAGPKPRIIGITRREWAGQHTPGTVREGTRLVQDQATGRYGV